MEQEQHLEQPNKRKWAAVAVILPCFILAGSIALFILTWIKEPKAKIQEPSQEDILQEQMLTEAFTRQADSEAEAADGESLQEPEAVQPQETGEPEAAVSDASKEEVKKISVSEFEAEAGKTLSNLELNLVEEGELQVQLRGHIGDEIIELDTVIYGIDSDAPEIKNVKADYRVSAADVIVPVTITAEAVDNYSLPSELTYAMGREKEPDAEALEWSDALPLVRDIAQNGTYYLFVRDRAGNIGTEAIELITVDMKPPVISEVRIQTPADDSGKRQIEVTATDKTELEYSFCRQGEESGSWQKESVYPVTDSGEYIVRVRDAAGNTAEESITVSGMDATAPVIIGIEEIAKTEEKTE